MKSLTLSLAILTGSSLQPLAAQEAPSPRANAIYLEVLGNGGLFSLNYERLVSTKVTLRVGVANWTIQDEDKKTVTTVPLTVANLPSGGGRGWELGGGLVLGKKEEAEVDLASGGWQASESTAVMDRRHPGLSLVVAQRMDASGGIYALCGSFGRLPRRGFLPLNRVKLRPDILTESESDPIGPPALTICRRGH
jgi:hypothetical protein